MNVPNSLDTENFYDELMTGGRRRGILGKEKRFNPRKIAQSPSTKEYFFQVIKPFLKPTDVVLDFGCGPGSFVISAAPLCEKIVGVDISENFVLEGKRAVTDLEISNATFAHIRPDEIPFDNDHFDAILLVDVIHHLENKEKSLTEAFRVLKPNGRVLIYEPNKLNPILYLVHLLDKNEWGLLRLGSPKIYRRLLAPFMSIDQIDYNGIVIGPEFRIFKWAACILNKRSVYPYLGWLNPKLFITGRKILRSPPKTTATQK